jgi:hypothetical protein
MKVSGPDIHPIHASLPLVSDIKHRGLTVEEDDAKRETELSSESMPHDPPNSPSSHKAGCMLEPVPERELKKHSC